MEKLGKVDIYNTLEYLDLKVSFVINRVFLTQGSRYNFINVSKILWYVAMLNCSSEEVEQGTICQEKLYLHRNPQV